MKVVKERFTKLLHHGGMRTGPIWQKRFYDFNVCSTEKRIEKLRYMHRNPVKRCLAEKPEEWKWSSFRTYARSRHPADAPRLDERVATPSRARRKPTRAGCGRQ